MILESQLLDAWQGTGAQWKPGSGTDYDRACGVTDWVGVVPVGNGEALVLGADPTPTGVLEVPDGVVLVRWIHAPKGWAPPEARELLKESWKDSLRWVIGGSAQVIQDSAFPGRDGGIPRLSMALRSGQYRVDTAEYRPAPEVWMILHRIVGEDGGA